MASKALRTVATRGKLLTKSTFSGYDVCMNPYVGCEFGCSYCYVRFFIKDDTKPWGEFVRVREHLEEKLPKEIAKGVVNLGKGRSIAVNEARLVLGTMTDPYQPAEIKHRITRAALAALLHKDAPKFKKVGIFTRSPLVLQDVDLIRQLPNARVHFTVTPFPPDLLRVIEPYSPTTERRWDVVKKLKEAGIRTHVNVSPVMPGMSEEYIETFVEKLIELKVDEYFVDPMQPYKESFDAFREACKKVPRISWQEIENTMTNRVEYGTWKMTYLGRWQAARAKLQHKMPEQLPIWSDHEHRVWVDMRTSTPMSRRTYGDEAPEPAPTVPTIHTDFEDETPNWD